MNGGEAPDHSACILLDFHVMRHMADIEAVHTFEGTETLPILIVGRGITRLSAFSK